VTLRVYGIATCDTCRKARKWLEAQALEFTWVDLRQSPPDCDRLRRWLDAAGAGRLVNRRSTSWRALDDSARAGADGPGAAALLHRHPTLIKRPVFELGDSILVGFDDAARARLTGR